MLSSSAVPRGVKCWSAIRVGEKSNVVMYIYNPGYLPNVGYPPNATETDILNTQNGGPTLLHICDRFIPIVIKNIDHLYNIYCFGPPGVEGIVCGVLSSGGHKIERSPIEMPSRCMFHEKSAINYCQSIAKGEFEKPWVDAFKRLEQ